MFFNLKTKTYNLLRWSEKWMKTDMVYLAKGGFWLIIGQIISSLSSFILAIVFANLVSKEIYGTYKYILSLIGALGALTLTGMNIAVIQATARGFEGSLKKSFKVQLKWGVIFFITASLVSLYYFLNDNLTLSLSILIAGILLPISSSANTYTAFLNGKKEFKKAIKYNSILNITLVLSLCAAIILGAKVYFLVAIYFLAQTILNLIFYFRTINFFKPSETADETTIPYGKKLSLINIINILSVYLDRILIFHFFSAAEVAIYSIAIAAPEQIRGILKIPPALSLPKIAEKENYKISREFLIKIVKFSALIVATIIIYIALTPFLYHMFFPKYGESIIYSQLFSISLIFIAPAMLLISFLQAKIQATILYKYNIISSTVQIILIIVLISQWGIMGAVAAKIISAFFNLVYLSFLIRNKKRPAIMANVY